MPKSKRLTDIGKWEKSWYRKLNPEYKCFWHYILDRCNHAGIWEVDFETAGYFIQAPIDPELTKSLFKERYQEIKDGKKWFIPDFIPFQYGVQIAELNSNSPVHRGVINALKFESLYNASESLLKGFHNPFERTKNKNKNKVKNKVEDVFDLPDPEDKPARPADPTPYAEIFKLYQEKFTVGTQHKELAKDHKAGLRRMWEKYSKLEDWEAVFIEANKSQWCINTCPGIDHFCRKEGMNFARYLTMARRGPVPEKKEFENSDLSRFDGVENTGVIMRDGKVIQGKLP
jgi:hypothetical protein